MKPDPLLAVRRLAAWAGLLGAIVGITGLVGCGGGGGGGASPAPPPAEPTFTDRTVYSNAANASLATPSEARAVTRHTWASGTRTLAYTATAGHLTATQVGTGTAQASFFYVAYTLDGAALPTRPVTFFFNGGPGSASMWLHLGSFGPKRLAANMPSNQLVDRFALVDNAETLLDVSDLVFVDAVGTGQSQAIAPMTNRMFWGVEADARVFRDFIARWLEVNGRRESPRVVFGESYGTLRAALLAEELEAAGVGVDGVVLLSSILDYNSNCAVFDPGFVNCAGFLPSYAATAAHFNAATPPPADVDAFVLGSMDFADQRYGPAVAAFLAGTGQPDTTLISQLAAMSGAPVGTWQQQFSLQPDLYRERFRPGQLIGRYDSRIIGAVGSALARDGDPSLTVIETPFVNAINELLPQTLNYRNPSPYVSFTLAAINNWQWLHDGKGLPDGVPDLAAAMLLNPRLRVLSLNGRHDLATPFHQTVLDLRRFGNRPTISVQHIPGGHMTYLDDNGRRAQREVLGNFYRSLRTTP
ncbi:peptidase S10 [Aquincola sp. S2]|uniref:Peptidase S10 n=1 Tax=Pseudaquabacterium terrae TaxID=2732868 RepID=A0ABX2EQX5_9BURK|nr:peptidase S10 [Aquabacterium terrae]NRF70916.1 peptidase S10 [Aquabacterium terrae]